MKTHLLNFTFIVASIASSSLAQSPNPYEQMDVLGLGCGLGGFEPQFDANQGRQMLERQGVDPCIHDLILNDPVLRRGYVDAPSGWQVAAPDWSYSNVAPVPDELRGLDLTTPNPFLVSPAQPPAFVDTSSGATAAQTAMSEMGKAPTAAQLRQRAHQLRNQAKVNRASAALAERFAASSEERAGQTSLESQRIALTTQAIGHRNRAANLNASADQCEIQATELEAQADALERNQ